MEIGVCEVCGQKFDALWERKYLNPEDTIRVMTICEECERQKCGGIIDYEVD